MYISAYRLCLTNYVNNNGNFACQIIKISRKLDAFIIAQKVLIRYDTSHRTVIVVIRFPRARRSASFQTSSYSRAVYRSVIVGRWQWTKLQSNLHGNNLITWGRLGNATQRCSTRVARVRIMHSKAREGRVPVIRCLSLYLLSFAMP